MRRAICFSVKFLFSLVVLAVGCTVVWDYAVKDRLYHCTDSVGFDFLAPGHWVHRPVAVQQIVAHGPMSARDTIKRGWCIAGLWVLWGLCVATALVVSISVAFVPWIPSRRRERKMF